MAQAAVRSKAVVLLLLTFCLLSLPLWESVIVRCFVVRYFMSIVALLSSWWGRESWLLCLICLPGVLWWLGGFPRGATGLSAVCDCGISWPYSLTTFGTGVLFFWPPLCLMMHLFLMLRIRSLNFSSNCYRLIWYWCLFLTTSMPHGSLIFNAC